MKNITFIGSGNVVTILSYELKQKGYNIVEIWSNTEKSAKTLANKLSCDYTTKLDNLKICDLFIVSVKDEFVHEVIKSIPKLKIPIVHTSGSVGIDIFSNKKNFGVFYPLQTFTKDVNIDFNNLPIFIEANNKILEKKLVKIAKSISSNIHLIDSIQRSKIHIAAVISCNFSNHMLSIAEHLMSKNNLNFNLLKPLIEQTFKKALIKSPKKVQTGPAIRNDYQTIEKHIDYLSDEENISEIYKMISNNIMFLNNNE